MTESEQQIFTMLKEIKQEIAQIKEEQITRKLVSESLKLFIKYEESKRKA